MHVQCMAHLEESIVRCVRSCSTHSGLVQRSVVSSRELQATAVAVESKPLCEHALPCFQTLSGGLSSAIR